MVQGLPTTAQSAPADAAGGLYVVSQCCLPYGIDGEQNMGLVEVYLVQWAERPKDCYFMSRNPKSRNL